MRYIVLTSLAFFIAFAPGSHAATVADSLSRMDAIIKEIEALRTEFVKLSESPIAKPILAAPAPAVLGAQSKSFFTQSLELGETNSDIKKIQKLLATDSEIYPYGVSSGFFGPKTEEGIKNFQTRFGLSAVGVVGPSTKALLELFFSAYPDNVYPKDVLKKKPTVHGVPTSVVTPKPAPSAPVVTTPVVSSGKTISSMKAEYESGEADVTVKYTDGTKKSIHVTGESKLKVIDAVALALGAKKATVLSLIEFVSASFSSDEDEDEDEDKDESSDDDEIDSITVAVANGEAEVEVEYANGDDEDFTIEETKESEIIEEIADELNIDESDVEDVIEFEYEDIEKIEVTVDEEADSALTTVTFEDGTTKRVKIDSADEDDIIEELADELGEDEEDIEDLTDFDY
jgi:peptidoglycan hydrolase-like protein with peptidoglycan-binding domain